jgi:hypothetical protein
MIKLVKSNTQRIQTSTHKLSREMRKCTTVDKLVLIGIILFAILVIITLFPFMPRKEQKKKKLQSISHPPKLLAKSGSSVLSPKKKEPDVSKEIFLEPIFRTRRFDLF